MITKNCSFKGIWACCQQYSMGNTSLTKAVAQVASSTCCILVFPQPVASSANIIGVLLTSIDAVMIWISTVCHCYLFEYAYCDHNVRKLYTYKLGTYSEIHKKKKKNRRFTRDLAILAHPRSTCKSSMISTLILMQMAEAAPK